MNLFKWLLAEKINWDNILQFARKINSKKKHIDIDQLYDKIKNNNETSEKYC